LHSDFFVAKLQPKSDWGVPHGDSGTEKKPTEPDTVNAVVGNSENMIPEGNFPSSILPEVFPTQQNRFSSS